MISEAQRKRMEENRAAALARRLQSKADSQPAIGHQSTHNPSNPAPIYESSHNLRAQIPSNFITNSFSHSNNVPLNGHYPIQNTKFSQYRGNPLTHNPDKLKFMENHVLQDHVGGCQIQNIGNHSSTNIENPDHVGHDLGQYPQGNNFPFGIGPISHRNFLMEADRRYPASKKYRMSSDSWVPGQCPSKCESNPLSNGECTAQVLPLKFIEVSLELLVFDKFSVQILDPSDAAKELRCWLVNSVTPLLEESSPAFVSYHVKDYKNVLQKLRDKPGIVLHQLPQSTLSVILKMLQVSYSPQHWVPFMPNHIPDVAVDELVQRIPCKLKAALLPFQLEGVKYGLRRGGRCLIADEMGVGKTIQAISMAACYVKEGSILITCPASLRLMWAEELERWLPFLLPVDVHLVFGRKNSIPDDAKTPKVVVISYTMLRRLKKQIMARKWAMLIVDESHNVRCTRSKVECEETTAILNIALNIRRIVLLSGTPSLSRPFDIFHQVNILSPCLLGRSKYDFAKSYCFTQSLEANQGLWPKNFSKGRRLHELSILLKETIMVRRLKGDVLAQLPPKRRQVIRLTLEASDVLEVKEHMEGNNVKSQPCTCGFSLKGCCDCDEDDDESICKDAQDDSIHKEGKIKERPTLSYQEIGVAKLKGVREWLSNHPIISNHGEMASNGHDEQVQKMIIFGHHIKVLDSIQEMVHSKGLEYVRVDGSTLTSDRQKAVDAFRSVAKIKVAIIGLSAGGVGLDFSSAQTVIFAELPKSSSVLLQAEDRAHRRGQKCAVNIYFFCAKDTSDEMQWQTLSKSLERVSTMTNGSENAITGIEVDAVLTASDKEVLSSPMSGEEEEQKLLSNHKEGTSNHKEGTTQDNAKESKVYTVEKSASQEGKMEFLTAGTMLECTSHVNEKDEERSGVKVRNVIVGKANLGADIVSEDTTESDVVHSTPLMFEVSANTRRIHLFARSDSDGYRPMPLEENFLPEDLELSKDSSNSQKCNALPSCLKQGPANLSCAITFLQQWNALRPVDRNCLLGRPLQLPLAFELECSKADNGLVKGGSKRRVTPTSEINSNIPKDATWRKITLNRQSFKERQMQQAWSSSEEPLCKLCYNPCLALNAKSPEYFEDLFCTKECYQQFRIKTSQAYLRQELFDLEKGVCTLCKLDCHALVEKIRPLSCEQRRKYILRQAPQFNNNQRLLEKLVSDAKEGNAWHADHIVAVYHGGGECNLHNMRTLCTICHAKVTAEQNRKRRKSLNRAKAGFQATIENFIEKWCEKRMQVCAPQDGDAKHLSGNESSEDEADNDILKIEITGSIYSKKEEAK